MRKLILLELSTFLLILIILRIELPTISMFFIFIGEFILFFVATN